MAATNRMHIRCSAKVSESMSRTPWTSGVRYALVAQETCVAEQRNAPACRSPAFAAAVPLPPRRAKGAFGGSAFSFGCRPPGARRHPPFHGGDGVGRPGRLGCQPRYCVQTCQLRIAPVRRAGGGRTRARGWDFSRLDGQPEPARCRSPPRRMPHIARRGPAKACNSGAKGKIAQQAMRLGLGLGPEGRWSSPVYGSLVRWWPSELPARPG